MTPEEVVEAYLDISLNMTDLSEKEMLLELTTGALHTAIVQASDDTLKKAFIDKNYELVSYSVVERRDRTPRETEITFELVYLNLGDSRELTPEKAPKISTENTVSVIKDKKKWYIRDVVGKKTEIDFPLQNAEVVTK
ncbi:MAG: hypothetical protein HQK54_02040 [Oligoflexales bacterium]|nr:hypothetical protein [Oligoflexales bacterium]